MASGISNTFRLGGVAVGLAGAALVSRVLTSLLFGVGPYDPESFAGMSVLLSAVVLVGAAPRTDVQGDDDIDVMVLSLPGGVDPRIELAITAPAELVRERRTIRNRIRSPLERLPDESFARSAAR